MTDRRQQWGIVGGGMLGMCLAHRLAKSGQSVTIVEAKSHLGGMASSWRLGDLVWDRYYHVLLLSDRHLLSLLRELRLDKEMVWGETKTGFYTDGRLYSMSNTLEFLRFPPLSIMNKIRLGMTIYYASTINSWRRLERIRAVDWLERWSGTSTTAKIWIPLLRAKLGENYDRASASFIWAIIARMYVARRTGLKKEMFGYVRGGYGRVMQRFEEVLRGEGVQIETGNASGSIRSAPDGGMLIECHDGANRRFDKVIATVPSPLAAQLCEGLHTREKQALQSVTYLGIVCAAVLLKKPLAGYYVTNITEGWVPFSAVIEMSALVDSEAFGGKSLVYLPKYLTQDDALNEKNDTEIEELFLNALCRMYPHISRADVVLFQVSRERYVFALPTIGYSDTVPPIRTSIRGLYIVNSSHIVNDTLNVNQTTKLAEETFSKVMCDMAAASGSGNSTAPGAGAGSLPAWRDPS